MPLGAAISGVSNIIGNLIGKKSQDKTNQANLKINQMNNEFNAREAEKAFLRESQYNDRVRAEDRAYNSAQSQVERYRQAGLNPALMMQGQSAGMAQSNGVSSSAASAAQSAPQQAFSPDLGMLGTAIEGTMNRLQQQQLIKEQVNALRIENQYKAQKTMAEIANTYADAKSKEAKAKFDNTLESLQQGLYQIQRDRVDSQIYVERHQAKLLYTQNLLARKELATFEQKFGEESALRVANRLAVVAQTSKTKQELRTEVFNTLMTQYQADAAKTGARISKQEFENLKRSSDDLVKQIEADKNNKVYDPYFRTADVVGRFVGTGIGAYMAFKQPKGYRGRGRGSNFNE